MDAIQVHQLRLSVPSKCQESMSPSPISRNAPGVNFTSLVAQMVKNPPAM